MRFPRLWHIGFAILVLKVSLLTYLLITILPAVDVLSDLFGQSFYIYILIGFAAQMVDGALGMAYGISCSSMLLHFGVSPKVASAAVHTAEVFTTGVSGLSHIRFRNIDKRLFLRLVFPGVAGAMLGAYFLSEMIDGDFIKPFVSFYLLILGLILLRTGIINKPKAHTEVKRAGLLALIGGFLDSIGGGGWGPVVTSNIMQQGKSPKETIGTVNTTEFFVAYFSTGVFLFFVGIESWPVIAGLILGGIVAAPIGAYLTHKINKRILMIMVGTIVILTSLYSIWQVFLKS